MKKLPIDAKAFGWFFSLVFLGFTNLNAAVPVEQIQGTFHDLSPRNYDGSMDNQICAFCHTPHGSSSYFSGAPLWNKGNPLRTSFTLYGATAPDTAGETMAGTLSTATLNPASAVCLSCHDGVSGINSIVNVAGTGGYVATGQYVNYNGNYTPVNLSGLFAVGQSGDLTNDHPVSIPYRGDEATPPAGLRPTNFVLTEWVGATTIADLLRDGYVECGSCHNPHARSATFLKTDNNKASKVCIACHDK
ncbi:MAG: hypothetical protein QG567_237 [Campylobacterota bacterium]|nr:hypothetical protein [Campylobacterota bacterium]